MLRKHKQLFVLAPRSDINPLTVQDYEAIDDNVACREDTVAVILKEVEEIGDCESEDEIHHDNIQSSTVSISEASQAVETLQQYFQQEGCLEYMHSLTKMNAYLVKQQQTNLEHTTSHNFFWGLNS